MDLSGAQTLTLVGSLLSLCLLFKAADYLFRRAALASVADFFENVFIAVTLFFAVLRPFVVEGVCIPTGSMRPVLCENDRLFANRFLYRFTEPQRGDVIIFDAPPDAAEQPTRFVKRVVGLEGDRIKAVNGRLWINGCPVDEPYAHGITYDFPQPGYENEHLIVVDDEVVVPRGYLFVMGDNRPSSDDSRRWGYVPRKAVLGKAVMRFWPLSRAQVIDNAGPQPLALGPAGNAADTRPPHGAAGGNSSGWSFPGATGNF